MNFTVLGAQGFIGKHLAEELSRRGHAPFCPKRDEDLSGRKLGVVFYCIGLTADFRERPIDTVDAHVCVLTRLLRETEFDRLIYLSSTRVYRGLKGMATEDSELLINPNEFSDLYNLSKLMGEAACLAIGRNALVARLSNVFGPDFSSGNFLFDLIREACGEGVIRLRTAPESAKDYILVGDVVNALIALGEHPAPRFIYNVASGINLSNARICDGITREIGGSRWEVSPGAPLVTFPQIDISRSRQDLNLAPSDILIGLGDLIRLYRERKG